MVRFLFSHTQASAKSMIQASVVVRIISPNAMPFPDRYSHVGPFIDAIPRLQ